MLTQYIILVTLIYFRQVSLFQILQENIQGFTLLLFTGLFQNFYQILSYQKYIFQVLLTQVFLVSYIINTLNQLKILFFNQTKQILWSLIFPNVQENNFLHFQSFKYFNLEWIVFNFKSHNSSKIIIDLGILNATFLIIYIDFLYRYSHCKKIEYSIQLNNSSLVHTKQIYFKQKLSQIINLWPIFRFFQILIQSIRYIYRLIKFWEDVQNQLCN
ncbi:unnamed protein product (macronuclear) [Paramecium tetraurelia]|uniref:Transmembrane protein n=1 Tax=Paramecium tetraurelia TaxID=5888 RepID=A0CR46_PARTE|nr:uncharacterized protein GSPATT00009577001 [Paramecium tetraurelia]CAK73263.1 unnamed protein product [Paramecium tetraurelia]|eukprot:XP_001440660.1 hypothetical protein (macronuclear) [Paramecium tetraurelia strain d4-2]